MFHCRSRDGGEESMEDLDEVNKLRGSQREWKKCRQALRDERETSAEERDKP